MHKIFFIILALALTAGPVLAQNGVRQDQNQGTMTDVEDQAEVDLSEPSGVPDSPPAPPAPIREMIREKTMERAADRDATPTPAQRLKNAKAIKELKGNNGLGDRRRSRVANAVEALLQVADRNGGIGEQVREVAREQIELSGQAETKLLRAKKAGKLNKFFWGPDFASLKSARQDLNKVNSSLKKLSVMANDPALIADKADIEAQIKELSATRADLLAQIKEESGLFSLFGWIAKLMNGYNVGE